MAAQAGEDAVPAWPTVLSSVLHGVRERRDRRGRTARLISTNPLTVFPLAANPSSTLHTTILHPPLPALCAATLFLPASGPPAAPPLNPASHRSLAASAAALAALAPKSPPLGLAAPAAERGDDAPRSGRHDERETSAGVLTPVPVPLGAPVAVSRPRTSLRPVPAGGCVVLLPSASPSSLAPLPPHDDDAAPGRPPVEERPSCSRPLLRHARREIHPARAGRSSMLRRRRECVGEVRIGRTRDEKM